MTSHASNRAKNILDLAYRISLSYPELESLAKRLKADRFLEGSDLGEFLHGIALLKEVHAYLAVEAKRERVAA